MPKVDVIIPAYNAAHFLPSALASVEAQAEPDWRILLIDDGSTDATSEVVAPYAERLGPKLRFIQQQNAGLPAARNTAIRHSDAPVLALLDADDVWLPNRLSATLQRMEQVPAAGLAYGRITYIDLQDRRMETWPGNRGKQEGRIASLIYTRKVDLPCPTMTFRRAVLEQTGLFDETMRATEDRDLWLRIAQRAEVVYVPEVTALYRRSAGSMSADPGRMLRAQELFIAKHFGEPGCGWKQRQDALSLAYRQYAEGLGARGERRASLAAAARSVMLAPWEFRNARAALALLLQRQAKRM